MCLATWGLTASGAISVNILNTSNTIVSLTAPTVLSLNTWSHVTQTFSTIHGSRLYLNGALMVNMSVPNGRPPGPFIIIGTSPVNANNCHTGLVAPGQFYGSVDEFRVYGRELSTTDICALANP